MTPTIGRTAGEPARSWHHVRGMPRALAAAVWLVAVLGLCAPASAAIDVNITVTGTGGVYLQVPHSPFPTTEASCVVDPAHPVAQGTATTCSFPGVATYTCGASQCLIFNAVAPNGWAFGGWEPCGMICQGEGFFKPCAGTITTPCTFVTDGRTTAYDTADFNDARAPDVTITSGPAAGHVAINATRTATFAFANTNEPAESPTFLCALDGGTFAACPGSDTLHGVADGIHTLAVEAKDASGLVGSPVSRRWEQETPPTVAIASGPAPGSTVGVASAQFAFTSNKPPAEVADQCSLDGAAFRPCANPVTFAGLRDGAHTLAVRGAFRAPIDGSVIETPVVRRTWTVQLPDADGDGIPAPADCNDHNPSIHPGAVDVPGDGIDQNCDGHDAPFPPIGVALAIFFAYTTGPGAHATITSAVAAPVPAHATVRLTCRTRRHGCPFATKTLHIHRKVKKLRLTRLFRHAKLTPGARVVFEVTRPRTIGTYVQVTIRNGQPRRRNLCLAPGSRKPRGC